MGFMSDDEKYDHAHYAEHWKKNEDVEQSLKSLNIDKIANKITEWIWEQEQLEKDESWHDLVFGEACIKIWKLITEERN